MNVDDTSFRLKYRSRDGGSQLLSYVFHVNGKLYTAHVAVTSQGVGTLSFFEGDEKNMNVGHVDMGTVGARKVLATTEKILFHALDFLEQQGSPVRVFKFIVSDGLPSRMKIYRRYGAKVADQLGWKYSDTVYGCRIYK